jgi:hypothetical protein
MVPPLETPPEGAWHCPACPKIIPEGQESTNSVHQPEEIKPQSPFITANREDSIASTSRSAVPVRAPTRGKGALAEGEEVHLESQLLLRTPTERRWKSLHYLGLVGV